MAHLSNHIMALSTYTQSVLSKSYSGMLFRRYEFRKKQCKFVCPRECCVKSAAALCEHASGHLKSTSQLSEQSGAGETCISDVYSETLS